MNTSVFSFKNVQIAILKVDEWEKNFSQQNYAEKKICSKRIIEKEGVQFLLSQFFPNQKLSYNSNGKPQLDNGAFISISHSKSLVGIAWNLTHTIGLDIEEIHERILKVENRFIHPEEHIYSQSISDKIRIWCIKEALIKIYDNKTFNLRTDLRVRKIENDKWIGFVSKFPSQLIEFITFEYCNNVICINTGGEKQHSKTS
jgi:hypothetical protein